MNLSTTRTNLIRIYMYTSWDARVARASGALLGPSGPCGPLRGPRALQAFFGNCGPLRGHAGPLEALEALLKIRGPAGPFGAYSLLCAPSGPKISEDIRIEMNRDIRGILRGPASSSVAIGALRAC